jgi:hypothetical protein
VTRLAGALLALALLSTPAAAQTAGQWNSMAPLPFFPTAMHVLPTGKVMFYGGDVQGSPPGGPADTAVAWDPATGQTTTLAGPGYDLFCAGHSYLADGTLLVTGGHVLNFVGLAYASTYDPFANRWTRVSDMNAGRWYPTNTTLANGDVLVVSGQIDTSRGVDALPQVFNSASGMWRDLTNAQLALDLYPRMHLAPNGKVFNSGPSGITRSLDTSGTGTWTFVANRAGGYRDYGSSVMYDTGKLLFVGGGDPPTAAAEVIDLTAGSPSWRAVASMSRVRRQLNATLLPDGKVLVTGGTSGAGFNDTSSPVLTAEVWDPSTERWTTLASQTVGRFYHSVALLLPDARVMTAGGNGHPEVEVFSPPYLFAGARPTITAAPTGVGYGQTFSVQTPDAASISKVTWIRLPSVTHAFDQNQRINRLTFTQGAGTLNVTAPSDPNLAPPGHYMLFILNGQGVPSVARIVQIGGGTPPPGPTLTVSPTSVAAGGSVTATWSGITSATPTDWIGLYVPGAADSGYLAWVYVSCTHSPGAAQASGSCAFALPNGLTAGSYQLRLLANDGYTRLATSNTFTVTTTTSTTLSASPSSVAAGTSVTGTWSGIASPAPRDWIGVYAQGTADTAYLAWVYVSCSQSPAAGSAAGSCAIGLPTGLAAGTYELRLFANNGFTRLASSNTFTVTAAATTTLSASPTSVAAGASVTATWSGIAAPAPMDWIGVYAQGTADSAYRAWVYVSCSTTPATGRAAGSCAVSLPAGLAAGSYELRLFANNGFTRLATSNGFTVTP